MPDNSEQLIIKLNSEIDEADARLIPHVAYSVNNEFQRIVVLSNDTDVVVLLVHYFQSFKQGSLKLWERYGYGVHQTFIPVHTLVGKIGPMATSGILAAHVLSGCDFTSRVGSKAAALKKHHGIPSIIWWGKIY